MSKKKLLKLVERSIGHFYLENICQSVQFFCKKKINGGALCTGDSLAQVSSQTMGNISVIDSTRDMSIFRPLFVL